MDITKLKPLKISQYAEEKVIKDFFPNFVIEQYLNETEISSTEMEINAGALCLYATTLLTKIFENAPESIEFEAKEREIKLVEAIKSHRKFLTLSDEDALKMAHNLIIKDIRNSFAHGNFQISYDIYSKKLNFVLMPQRKDFIVDKPIVISKKALIEANKKFIEGIASRIVSFNLKEDENKSVLNLSETMKKLVFPAELLKLTEFYLNNKKTKRQPLVIDEKKYPLIHYILMVTKITYEQDDYYSIFGKDSKMFEKIAHIRNSIAHDSYSFANLVERINYNDREKTLMETVQESVVSLRIANDLKNLIMRMKNEEHSEEAIQTLTNKLKMFFDMMFCGVMYKPEDFFEKE